MAEKTFNTKLKLRYDSYENWIANDPQLLAGEIALAAVSTKQDGAVEHVPSVLIKCGDGSHKYSELDYVFAKAADVISAAKSETALTTFINNVIADAGIATSEAMEALAGKVTTAEGEIDALQTTVGDADSGLVKDVAALEALVGDTKVADQITAAITALKLDETYAAKTHTHEMADVNGLADALAGKQAAGDYATKAEAQGYADAKDEAIAAAKKAGDDAQADVDTLETYVGTIPDGYTETNIVAYINKKAEETLNSASGGSSESAASVLAALNTYKSENDPKVTANTEAIDALEVLVGDTKVSDQISTAVAAEAEIARAAEKANADAIDAIEADYLKTADKTELTEAIATAKQEAIEAILDGVTDDFDTLKEVAAWIQSDTTASAELVTRVSNIEADYLKGADKTTLQGEIDALETFVGELPEDATSDTVVEYIQEVVDGLKIGDYAKAADLTALAERVTAAESAIEVLEGKVGDKTVAEQITDVTDAMSEKITTLEGKAHTHENATVLDGITAEKVAAWDKVSEKANDADLAAVAKSGLIDDLSIGESTVLIFDCGDSNV